MSNLEYGFSPEPLSCYADHEHFDYYYRREDRTPKKGQPWDLFHAWGQERLLLCKRNGETEAVSSRLPMEYTATSCALPSMPPNVAVQSDLINPGLQVLQEQRELTQMKEALLYRIPLTKRKTINYGQEVKEVTAQAKKLLLQLKTDGGAPSNLSSTESDDSDSDGEAINKRYREANPPDVESADLSSTRLQEEIEYFTKCPLIKRVLCDFHNDSRLFSDVRVPTLPTHYLGGCLNCTHVAGTAYIAHTTGSQMSGVAVKQLGAGPGLTNMRLAGLYESDDTVCQVALQAYSSELFLAVRSGHALAFCTTASDTTQQRDMVKKFNIKHVSLSPYFPECIYVQDHCIYKWTESAQSTLLLSDWTPRFPSVSSLETVHYSCHPRQLVMTDPTVCSLYDTRSRMHMDLFEVPSNTFLQKEELLVTSLQSRDFTHHILAQHTLLSVDERFPKYPVMYQVLPVLAQPMLVDSLQLDNDTDLLVLACPTNQETFAMVIDYTHSIIRSTPIWQCSQPSDISHFHDTKPPISDRLTIDARLNTGLVGLTATRYSKDAFTVHMLSGQGDLFEQTYRKNIETEQLCDRTKAAGPVIESPSMSIDVSKHCQVWYDVVVGQQMDDCTEDPLGATLFISKNSLLPARDGCPICKVQTDGVANDSVDSFPCLSCGLTFEQSAVFVENHQKGKYYDSHQETFIDPVLLRSYDPEKEAGSDSNSNLLLKLWKEEDISQELAKRNKDWDERRAILAKQEQEGTLGSEDLDALSSLSGLPNKAGVLRAGSTSGHSKASTRTLKSVKKQAGFASPRTRFRGDSDAGSTHSINAFFTPDLGSLWTGESSFQATQASQKKSKGKKLKGF
ncbi:uncharacterized protein [Watersipora subatra]|uniref:uncharacterized protein n=1 Tax=Watersipora subatra TaxID=2589382 RepID=UPI00355C40BB